jgi:hypothetical protein
MIDRFSAYGIAHVALSSVLRSALLTSSSARYNPSLSTSHGRAYFVQIGTTLRKLANSTDHCCSYLYTFMLHCATSMHLVLTLHVWMLA